MLKEQLINALIKKEGGYVNHLDDKGGETNFGITRAVARENGYEGEMRAMKIEEAFRIYADRYWEISNLDEMLTLSKKITAEIFDTSVLMGVSNSAKFLQRCLNVLNRQEVYYGDLVVDGIIGIRTLSSLKDFLKARNEKGESVLLGMLNTLQGHRLIEITERRERNETFVYGWFLNRVF